MNILILSWRGPNHPNAGGAEVSTHEHSKGWIKAGHKVTLFTSFFRGAKKEEYIDGIRIIRKGSYAFGVHWEAFRWYLFNEEKFDLVIDQFHGIPFFTPLYVKEKKMAFIHEVTKEVWGLNPWPKPFNLIPAIIGTIFEPLIFKLFYTKIQFLTVSESTKEDLMKWSIPQSNITVIHNGISSPTIEKVKKEEKPTVIFLGALSKDKGIEDVLVSISLLNKIKDNFQYWIVGKADVAYGQYLKQQTENLNIKNQVKFFGYVSEEEKYKLLARAHILINASIREGWGLVVIEAASVGTPTIAYDSPGLRDSVKDGETGLLCKDKTPEDLAKNAIRVFEDKQLYIRLSANSIKWSKNFSWEDSSDRSLRLIEKIVS